MHLSHEVLYVLVAFLAGGLLGTINGFCLFGAWMMGMIFPATVPEQWARNDTLAAIGKNAPSKLLTELPFARSNEYDFFKDNIGNVTYEKKLPSASLRS